MPTGNTQQQINYGATANDGQGDPLRTAFIKTDDNFDNVWLAGPVGSNVRITNNTIGVLDTNGNLILSPNGVGVIQTNNHVVPRLNRTYDLGTANLTYRTVYANTATFQTLGLAGNLSVGGNLTVSGNIIQVGNIVTETLTIQLANAASTANAANGAGITVGANDNIATLIYNSTSNVWTTNIGVSATGNITAPYFIGNGSQLTGITSYANANAVAYGQAGWAGNIIPSGNGVYSLGNATNQWNDLYVSNATIYMNNIPLSMTAGNVLTVNGQPVLSNNSNTAITTTGNITANYFIGDGSQLTGVSSTGNLDIVGTAISIAAGAAETLIAISPSIEGQAYIQVPDDATANIDNLRIHNDVGNIEFGTGSGSNLWYFNNDGSTIFPTLSTQRGDNPSGTIQGQTLLFGDNSQEAIISTPDGVAGNEYSQRLVINPGSGYNYGEGGDIYLWAGRGGNGGGSGGDIKIRGGQGGADNGQGGYIRMEGGDGDYAGGSPGFIEITGGSGGVGQNGGYVRIQGGQGQNYGADANITGGVGQSGPGGAVNIVGGVSGLGLGDYGNVNITSGVSTWTFDNQGTLNLPGGTGIIESTANNISIYSDAGQLNGALFYDTGSEIYALQDFAIFTDNANASHIWRFYANGSMTAPGAINVGDMSIGTVPGDITATNNTTVAFNVTGSDGGFLVNYLKEVGNANTSQGELALNSELGNTTYRISLTDDSGDGFATKIWRFDGTGNLSLPSGGSVYSEGFTPSGNPGNTIILNPHGSGSITNQKLMLYPTAADGDHLHMTTGNLYETELFLGSDNFYVKLANTGNVVVYSNDSVGNVAQWTFGTDGILTFPSLANISGGNFNAGTASATVALNAFSPDGNTVSIQAQGNSSSAVISIFANSGPVTNDWTFTHAPLDPTEAYLYVPGGASITTPNATGGAGGKNIFIEAGAADQSDFYTGAGGELMLKGGRGAFNDGGGGGPGGNVNINAGESADPAGHAGNVYITAGALQNWVFDYTGNLTIPNGMFAQEIASPAPVISGFTFIGSLSGPVSTTGNVTAGNVNVTTATGNLVLGKASATGSPGLNSTNSLTVVTDRFGTPKEWVFTTAGDFTGTGNISGGNLSVTGQVSGQTLSSTQSTANEGGEITLAIPSSGSTLSTSITIDSYQNRLRFFETGGSTRGMFIDLANMGNITTSDAQIGYINIPQVSFSANATAALSDSGKHYYSTTAGNLALTLPDNSNVAFATGTTLTIVVNAAGNVLVNQGTGVSLYMAGSSATGNRAVGAYGLASVMKVAANTWVISGTGVY